MARGGIDATVALAKVERVILGSGPLTTHAGIYLLSAFGLLVRGVIRDPAGLAFPAPWIVVPWGLLVLVHAAIVAAATVMRQPEVGTDYRDDPGDRGQGAALHPAGGPAWETTPGLAGPDGRAGSRMASATETSSPVLPVTVTQTHRAPEVRDTGREIYGREAQSSPAPVPAAAAPAAPPPTARFRPQRAASLADVAGRADRGSGVPGGQWSRSARLPRWVMATAGRLRSNRRSLPPQPRGGPVNAATGQPVSSPGPGIGRPMEPGDRTPTIDPYRPMPDRGWSDVPDGSTSAPRRHGDSGTMASLTPNEPRPPGARERPTAVARDGRSASDVRGAAGTPRPWPVSSPLDPASTAATPGSGGPGGRPVVVEAGVVPPGAMNPPEPGDGVADQAPSGDTEGPPESGAGSGMGPRPTRISNPDRRSPTPGEDGVGPGPVRS